MFNVKLLDFNFLNVSNLYRNRNTNALLFSNVSNYFSIKFWQWFNYCFSAVRICLNGMDSHRVLDRGWAPNGDLHLLLPILSHKNIHTHSLCPIMPIYANVCLISNSKWVIESLLVIVMFELKLSTVSICPSCLL